ncbi:MAG: type I 3-dehydroquinate dehydratase [Muribaculaceae bacterium]|nr:type I 3-dehydroquinate dehydratase [Roseburia sp.]MCM1430523.1 type I 3-dehydroquinate dehydratase [Muribaculaceae bacterium]MCM1493196.1 type I 3-dehydroquinate dehydratase [Muribaculaceae bacterium]
MENLCVKGRTIGIGQPLVCVPVMGADREAVVGEVKRLLALSVDMMEWRVDAFSQAESPNAVREVLMELAPLLSDTIFVYTFRSKRQGGLRELDREQIRDIREAAAETGVVDFIDVEFFEERYPEREVKKLQEMGAYVIASHHDFAGTPERNVIRMILSRLHESGADVVKLALMPRQMQDVLNLLEETNSFHEAYPMQALITMSMGAMGTVSRVAGEFFGSCVTFGAGAVASAPGQLPQEELKHLLSVLHEAGNV